MKIESKIFTELRGRMAGLAAQMRKGKIVLSKLGIPYHASGAERSAPQKIIWQRYGKIVEDWDKLTPVQKAAYAAMGTPMMISGWNAFVHEKMIWNGLVGWTEKKVGTITGSTAGAQTNYQTRVKAWKGTGTSSGENVYLGADVRNDFGDIRFTKDNGQTLYDYWMESKVDGSYAIFWIKIPSIPIAPETTNFWLQHGNPAAATTSNGTNTFMLFNDFTSDMSGWTSIDSISVSGGKLVSAGSGVIAGYAGDVSWGDYIIEGTKQSFAYYEGLIFRRSSNTSFYLMYTDVWDGVKNNQLTFEQSGRIGLATGSLITYRNTDYKFKIVVVGSNIKYYDTTTGSDVLIINYTHASPLLTGNIGFGRAVSGAYHGSLDNIRVRKYVSPEPTISSWI